ncbi:MAG: hypothetical protein H7293_04010 [Candidatus Saccharibacteria bacterium]|nr:hypothetical protein [Rhodoferax sp.]
MIAGDLIRQARASGIELRLVGGRVKAIGPREAVTRLLEPLRQHREALTYALQFELQVQLPTVPPADETPDPTDWHALDAAYLDHHFKCPTCIAAGRGSRYGLRCGVGSALWVNYQKT